MIDTSLPSEVAPRATRCSVAGRCPFVKKSCLRGNHNFTGRFTTYVANAAANTCGHVHPLLPNAPPTNGDMTSMFSFGMPNAFAIVVRTAKMFCDESCSVSRLPSHDATSECASIGL